MSVSRKAVAAPDGGWGWLVVLGSAIVHMMLTGMSRSFGVFYVVLLDRFGATDAATSIIPALFNMFRMMLGPLATMLSERFGSRRVVMIGGLILSAGGIASAFANSIFHMYLSFGVLSGVGSCLAFTPSLIIVGKYFDRNKGKAMSLSTLGNGLGAFTLAPLITLLLHTYGYAGGWLIISGLMLHVCIAGALFRPLQASPNACEDQELEVIKTSDSDIERLNNTQGDCQDSEQKVKVSNGAIEEHDEDHVTIETTSKKSNFCSGLKNQLEVLKNPTFVAYGFAIMAMPVLNATVLNMLPALARSRGLSDTQGAFLVSLSGVSDCVGRFLFGVFFDLKWVRPNRPHFHVLTGIIPAILAGILPFMPNYGILITIVCCYGFIYSGFNGQRVTVLSNFISKEQLPKATGYLICFQGLGHSYGLILSGHLKDRFGNYDICYHFVGCYMIVWTSMYWVVMFCMRMRKRH